ncbi:MAG: hypothetical protein JNL74_11100, partial [Fibrobacteres bacterium]|nr:hypothetical protein [Fibrobacterota bacterium]
TFFIPSLPPITVHLLLKMLLNAHSTLVMGRLGRYDGNVMTFVRPTNNKLIDRTVRYSRLILERKGIRISYEDGVRACFRATETTPPDKSIVHSIVSAFTA